MMKRRHKKWLKEEEENERLNEKVRNKWRNWKTTHTKATMWCRRRRRRRRKHAMMLMKNLKMTQNTSSTMKFPRITRLRRQTLMKNNFTAICTNRVPWKRYYGYWLYPVVSCNTCHVEAAFMSEYVCASGAQNAANDRRKLCWRGDKDCFELNYE